MAKSKSKKTPSSFVTSRKVIESDDGILDDLDVVEDLTSEEPEDIVEDIKEEELEVVPEVKVEKVKLSTPKVPEQPNTKLLTLKTHLDEYLILHKTPVITPAVRQQIIKKLHLIIRFVVNNPHTDILDEMFKFFKVNRYGVLAESVVFQGISSMANKPRLQLETFYTLFLALLATKTKKAKFTINLESVRNILNSDEIINYISSKLN